MSIDELLEQFDREIATPAGQLYTKVRGMYDRDMLDPELIVTACEDGKITREEALALCKYCNLK